jgi:hypothetical protein
MERNVRRKNTALPPNYRMVTNLTHLDQKALGMSMKVERASVDSVKERLAALKRKKEQPKEEYGELHLQQHHLTVFAHTYTCFIS